MRLPGGAIDDSQDASVRVKVRGRTGGNARSDSAIHEDIAAGADQPAQGSAARVGGEDVLPDASRPARRRLACGNDGAKRAVAEQTILTGVRQGDEGRPIV